MVWQVYLFNITYFWNVWYLQFLLCKLMFWYNSWLREATTNKVICYLFCVAQYIYTFILLFKCIRNNSLEDLLQNHFQLSRSLISLDVKDLTGGFMILDCDGSAVGWISEGGIWTVPLDWNPPGRCIEDWEGKDSEFTLPNPDWLAPPMIYDWDHHSNING